MIDLTKDDAQDILSSDDISVIDFHSTFCPPCQRMIKILPNLESKLIGIASLYKVDVDAESELAAKYDVDNVPTFIFFKDGKEVERFEGIKTLAEIEQITLHIKENGYGNKS